MLAWFGEHQDTETCQTARWWIILRAIIFGCDGQSQVCSEGSAYNHCLQLIQQLFQGRRFASRRRRRSGDCSRGLCSRLCPLTRTRLRLAWQSLWMSEQGLRVIRTMWGRRSWGTVTRPPSGSVRPVMTETLWQPLSPRPCHDALYLHPTPSAAVSTFGKKVIFGKLCFNKKIVVFSRKNTIRL